MRRGGLLRLVMVRLAMTAATLAAVGLSPAAAQTAPDAERTPIPHAQFLELFSGQTVYWRYEDGTPWGREYYRRGTNETVFIFASDGDCSEGSWVRQERQYCFTYKWETECWLNYFEGEKIVTEATFGLRGYVDRIEPNEPLSCEPDLVS